MYLLLSWCKVQLLVYWQVFNHSFIANNADVSSIHFSCSLRFTSRARPVQTTLIPSPPPPTELGSFTADQASNQWATVLQGLIAPSWCTFPINPLHIWMHWIQRFDRLWKPSPWPPYSLCWEVADSMRHYRSNGWVSEEIVCWRSE